MNSSPFSLVSILGLTLISGAAPVINEVHYGPEDKTTLTEFVEIFNPDSTAIDISDWSLSEGIRADIPSGTVIPAGGYIILAEDPTRLNSTFFIPSGTTVLPFNGILRNEGERIRLRDANGDEVDEVEYRNEFPWPVTASGAGPSMELLNPSLDNDLGGSWQSSFGQPTPGEQNSVFTSNPAPQMRQVRHTPQVPTDQQPLTVSVKATDPNTISSLTLSYQVNEAGNYIPARLPLSNGILQGSPNTPFQLNPAFEDPANWVSIPMTPTAEDPERYEATIPAQQHRSLLRYRITATDALGASVRAPALDDPSKNFAAFVYNGVPDYTANNSVHPDGNGKVYNSESLTQLPVYQLITRGDDLQRSYAYSGGIYQNHQIPKGNKAARKIFNWECALVYDGIVYDHVGYRLRQNNNRYSANGKRSMRFRFNRGHYFQARDEEGNEWPVKWRSLNTGKMSAFNSPTTYGIREVVNSKIWRKAGIECPFFYHIHFRVIDDEDEAPNQYDGDFFGLAMAFEDIDGNLLDARNLPDGNVYKFKDGESTALELLDNQARNSVSDGSDFNNHINTLNSNRSESELADMVDWNQWSLYHAVCEAIRQYDMGTAFSHRKNMAWYFQPADGSTFGKLRLIPHDHDSTWSRGYHDNLRIGIGRDFPWRAIFRQTSTIGDSRDRQPLKPSYNLIYRNTVRNFRELFWQERAIDTMITETLANIAEFTFPDRDRWSDGNIQSGRETLMQDPTTITTSMMNIAFTEDLVDRESLPGGRAAFLDRLSEDFDIPDKPTIIYTGDDSFTPGQVSFESSSFSDPQGNATFDSIEWRVAQINLPSAPIFNPTEITTGVDWSYRDTGENLGTAWRESAFDDSTWSSGPSPLGYNEVGLAQVISFGGNPNDKHITAYFRRSLTLTPEDLSNQFRFQILRDDGAVIYINGVEVARFGMAPGAVNYLTLANENARENQYDEFFVDGSSFVAGENVIAIELHQRTPGSSDTKLDVIVEQLVPAPDFLGESAFEWDASWEESSSTIATVTPPASAIRSGLTYRARVRHIDNTGRTSSWSDPIEFTAGAIDTSLYQNGLVIAEFLAHPRDATAQEETDGFSNSDFEFIRLRNISQVTLDLSNVRFTKGIDIDLSGELAAGEEIIIARNPAAYASRHSGASAFGPYEGKLKNEGERLKLSFGAGETIREFEYFNTPDWPTAPSGVFFSLALVAPQLNPDHALAASWRPILELASPETFAGIPTADADNDGVDALLEYALGSSDNDYSENPLSFNNGSFTFTRNANASDVNIRIIQSDNLQDWDILPELPVSTSTLTADGEWIVTYDYDLSAAKRFFRLEASQ